MPNPELYRELVFKLGDTAYERLWNKPNAPRATDRVIKAAEKLEALQVEQQEIETAINEEDAAYAEFREACEEEMAQCEAIVAKYKKIVSAAESKAKALEAAMVTKRKDAQAGRIALERLQASIKQAEEFGEHDKVKVMQLNMKKAKLDVMKRAREADEMQAEYDKVMNPEVGAGAEGIRARRRQKDLELQLEERTEQHNHLIGELTEQLAVKDDAVAAAQDYYEKSLYLLGEEVYRARIADPMLSAFYPKIDKTVA